MPPKSGDKLVYGVALNDVRGSMSYTDAATGKRVKIPAYRTWANMLKVCYSPIAPVEHPTYCGVTVCDEWLLFSTFQLWYDANFVEGYHLNRTLAQPGNKVFCPVACRFVPQYLSQLVNDVSSKRGSLLGVYYDPAQEKFTSTCQFNGKKRTIGLFADSLQAHHAWQRFKADAIVKTVQRYTDEAVVHEDVVQSLLDYAQRLRSDAAEGVVTLGFSAHSVESAGV